MHNAPSLKALETDPNLVAPGGDFVAGPPQTHRLRFLIIHNIIPTASSRNRKHRQYRFDLYRPIWSWRALPRSQVTQSNPEERRVRNRNKQSTLTHKRQIFFKICTAAATIVDRFGCDEPQARAPGRCGDNSCQYTARPRPWSCFIVFCAGRKWFLLEWFILMFFFFYTKSAFDRSLSVGFRSKVGIHLQRLTISMGIRKTIFEGVDRFIARKMQSYRNVSRSTVRFIHHFVRFRSS